jgi:hypothetical protein
MHRPLFRLVPLVVALALAVGCGSSPSTSTTSTPPTMVTDVFSGTVNANGGVSDSFLVLAAGQITATLTSVSPNPDTQLVGLAIGTWNGTACSTTSGIYDDSAKQGTAVIGTAGGTGTFCVRVYDVGAITDPVSFEVEVVHP